MEGYHELIDSGHREIYRLEPATTGRSEMAARRRLDA
jgi:hypothetical protein